MLEHAKLLIEYLAVGVELATAGLICFAVLEALVLAVPLFVRSRQPFQEAKIAVRLSLARWLALALEFALAADILRTAVAPSWHDIGQLGAIAALRTALNYFLGMEIEREEGVLGKSSEVESHARLRAATSGSSVQCSASTAAEQMNTTTASANSSPLS